jgi:hypothetical protein
MFNCISKVLPKHIKKVILLPRKLSCFILSIKGNLALKMPRVYSIPRKCDKVYFKQTGCLIEIKVKKHH